MSGLKPKGDIEKESDEVIQLSEGVFMYPAKKIGDHGNIYEGEVQSSIYGIRSCVIKITDDPEQTMKEAEILDKLGSHTNVISLIEAGRFDSGFEPQFYVASDKCHKENLGQFLMNRREQGLDFNLELAWGFIKQILDGVTYIHDSKVVHLDLKPSNILMTTSLAVIKIADFGLSIVLKSTKSKVRHKGQFGTNGYRPIESFGHGFVSHRTDIFSLGAVFYKILSNGRNAFGCDEHMLIENVKNDVKDLSGMLVPNPFTTKHLINCMLRKERWCRPNIWQVAEHPCWRRQEVECNFGYYSDNEINDSDVKDEPKKTFEKSRDLTEDEFERSKLFLFLVEEHDLCSSVSELQGQQPESTDPKTEDTRTTSFRAEETAKLLQRLSKLQVRDDFLSALEVAECELQLGRGNELEAFQRIKQAIQSNGSRSAEDIRQLAKENHKAGFHIRSLVLYHIANDIQDIRDSAWIDKLLLDISEPATALVVKGGQSTSIAKNLGLNYLTSILEDLPKKAKVHRDVKLMTEAKCLGLIGHIQFTMREYQKSIAYCERGMQVFEKRYGKNATDFSLYGFINVTLAKNLAFLRGRSSKSLLQFEKAFSAIESAKDIPGRMKYDVIAKLKTIYYGLKIFKAAGISSDVCMGTVNEVAAEVMKEVSDDHNHTGIENLAQCSVCIESLVKKIMPKLGLLKENPEDPTKLLEESLRSISASNIPTKELTTLITLCASLDSNASDSAKSQTKQSEIEKKSRDFSKRRRELETITSKLKTVKCELQLERGNEKGAIRQMKKVIHAAGVQSADDIREVASISNEKGHYIRALLLYKIAYAMFAKINSPFVIMIFYEIFQPLNALAKEKQQSASKTIELTVNFLLKILDDWKKMSNASVKQKWMNEARGLVMIAIIYFFLSDYHKTIDYCEQGIKTVEKHFGSDANNYFLYSWALAVSGMVLCCMPEDRFSDAMQHIKKGISALEEARDIDIHRKKEFSRDFKAFYYEMQMYKAGRTSHKALVELARGLLSE